MSRAEKVFESGFDNEYNLFTPMLLLIAILSFIWLAANDVRAGYIYLFIILFGLLIVFIAQLFFKGDSKLSGLTSFVRLPFTPSTPLAVLLFWIGAIIPFILNLIFKLTGSAFNITQLSIPTQSNQLTSFFITFAQAEIGSSYAWENFIVVFGAGVGETFIFNWAAILFGALIGLWLFAVLSSPNKRVLGLEKKSFVIASGIIISSILFVGAHMLNGTYMGSMFWIAGIFILVANISIYIAGIFLITWIGYHAGNNQLALIIQNGFSKWVNQALLSWYGVFLLVLFGLSMLYLLKKGPELKKDWQTYMGKLFG